MGAPLSSKRAVAELVLAAAIWGFGFIATRWTLAEVGPFWLSALRFLLAAAIALPFVAARGGLSRKQVLLAAPPGLLLGASLVFQTAGLVHTTATNSGFVTTLYILFVPLIGFAFLRQKIRALHFGLVLLALAGTALICRLESTAVNVGDLLTLACAVLAAGHLVWLSAIGKRIQSPFAFNAFQGFWAGLAALVVAIPFEAAPAIPGPRALGGLAFLVVVSTMLAFLLQVRAQRVLPASLASLLCLLESPFAALFAFLFLAERLAPLQWTGAALIMVASVLAVRLERPATERKPA